MVQRFFAVALPSQVWAHPYPTLPMHVRGRRSFSCAVLFCSFPMRCAAFRIQSITWLFFSKALPCFSFPVRRVAFPARCCAFLLRHVAVPGQAYRLPCKSWHIYALAAQSLAFPARCGCKHCRSYAACCISFALLYLAVPIRCISLLCTAPLCPRQAKQCQCLVLLFYSQSAHIVSQRCLFVSGPLSARLFRRLSAWTIACADISPW